MDAGGYLGDQGEFLLLRGYPFQLGGPRQKNWSKNILSRNEELLRFSCCMSREEYENRFSPFSWTLYMCSIVSMKGDTIVDFPNFNFRLCYEWIIYRSRTLLLGDISKQT